MAHASTDKQKLPSSPSVLLVCVQVPWKEMAVSLNVRIIGC